MYESIGNILEQQELLDLVQQLLCVDADDMPSHAAMRGRISRQNWVKGGNFPDFADEVLAKKDEYNKVDARKDRVRKGFEMVVVESVRDMSDGQDDDEETTEQIKARHIKYMENFLKKIFELRLVVRERHVDQLQQANAFIEKALELVYAPIDLSAGEEEFKDSVAKYEFGMTRLRNARDVLDTLNSLHLSESIVLGLDYNVGGVGEDRVDQSKALNEVRQNSKRLFEEQQKRYSEDRIVTQGRGERIAEALNTASNEVDTANTDDLVAEFDVEEQLNAENSNINNEFGDNERDFTANLQNDDNVSD